MKFDLQKELTHAIEAPASGRKLGDNPSQNPRHIKYKPQVLQRFDPPKVMGGRRSHFLLKELRSLIKARTLSPNRQLLALSLMLYIEGAIDFVAFEKAQAKDMAANHANEIPLCKGAAYPEQINERISDLINDLKEGKDE